MEQLFRTNGKLVILYSRNSLIVSIMPDCTKPMNIQWWFTFNKSKHEIQVDKIISKEKLGIRGTLNCRYIRIKAMADSIPVMATVLAFVLGLLILVPPVSGILLENMRTVAGLLPPKADGFSAIKNDFQDHVLIFLAIKNCLYARSGAYRQFV